VTWDGQNCGEKCENKDWRYYWMSDVASKDRKDSSSVWDRLQKPVCFQTILLKIEFILQVDSIEVIVIGA
jgi:Fe-S-cluster containining protein